MSLLRTLSYRSWWRQYDRRTLCVAGPVTGVVCSVFGCRSSVMAGGTLLAAGFLGSSFCSSLITLLLAFGIAIGQLNTGRTHRLGVVGYHSSSGCCGLSLIVWVLWVIAHRLGVVGYRSSSGCCGLSLIVWVLWVITHRLGVVGYHSSSGCCGLSLIVWV